MSYVKYRAFAVAAEQKSLAKAAKILGYTQSGVSHLIRALEEELGLTLLQRSRAGTYLTSDGAYLLPYVQTMLRAWNDTIQTAANLKGLTAGSLSVGTFSSVAVHILPSVLAAWHEKYPGVEILVKNGNYAAIETALLEGKLDCAFVTMPSKREFNIRVLANDRLLAIVSENSPLADKKEISIPELADVPFIVPCEGSEYDIGRLFQLTRIQPNVRFDLGDDYAAIELVRRDLGVTILPALVMLDMPVDGIRKIPIEGTHRQIAIATDERRTLSPAVRLFLDCVQQVTASLSKELFMG